MIGNDNNQGDHFNVGSILPQSINFPIGVASEFQVISFDNTIHQYRIRIHNFIDTTQLLANQSSSDTEKQILPKKGNLNRTIKNKLSP